MIMFIRENMVKYILVMVNQNQKEQKPLALRSGVCPKYTQSFKLYLILTFTKQ